jgi:hypothetical protein
MDVATAIIGIVVSLLFMVILVGVSVASYRAAQARSDAMSILFDLMRQQREGTENLQVCLQCYGQKVVYNKLGHYYEPCSVCSGR